MIWVILASHVATCVLALVVGDRIGRQVAFGAAVVPAVTAAWGVLLIGGDHTPSTRLNWVTGLGLELTFSVGPLAALLTVIVSGVGGLVFVYTAGYFDGDAEGMGRFTATLSAFGMSMLGLVWADSVWTLFVFWELTSITSFLLVGFKAVDPTAGLAARRALFITLAGGLALLAALVVLADATGTTRLSEMGPVGGTSAGIAAVLVLAAAATKSAQVPFHSWLPGAMTAPTPVSAYLHSATMVKAGVILVAVASPVLGATAVWKPLGIGLGVASMIWGAVGALRHRDAKLILAWGTISQLGLMIGLLSLGTAKATFAAISLIAAHAVFKAALFMVVGEIDVRTGTRDVRVLNGLARSMPGTFAFAALAGASMAGLPPLLGFPAKEAAIESVLGLHGAEALVVGGAVIAGSVLTVAYTVRLLVGLFASSPSAPATVVAPSRLSLTLPAIVLGAASLAGFVLLGWVNKAVGPAAAQVHPQAGVYELLRWPGFTTALTVSVAVVVAGALLGVYAWSLVRATSTVPGPLGANVVDGSIDGTVELARRITGRVQHGSLPVYLVTMAATATVASIPFVLAVRPGSLYRWDSGAQAMVSFGVVAVAIVSAVINSRLGAALGLGGVGLGIAALFVVHGAPDLALTQLLVETVVVVGFVVGLRHLTSRFPPVTHGWRGVRIAIATATATAVTLALLASASQQVGEAPLSALAQESLDTGGGRNIVNVILTDMRALDTLGEVMVLVVVAIGVLALARPNNGRPDHQEVSA